MSDQHSAEEANKNSFAAVARGDRDGWLALFAEDAVVQDPVGKSPFDPEGKGHRGKAAITRFYDQVISTTKTRFEVLTRVAPKGGDECMVHAKLHNEVGDFHSEIEIFAIYQVNAQGLIVSLRAFWDFDQVMMNAGQTKGDAQAAG